MKSNLHPNALLGDETLRVLKDAHIKLLASPEYIAFIEKAKPLLGNSILFRDFQSTCSRRSVTFAELPDCLTATDIAKYLGIAKSKVYQMLKTDGFPRLQINKRIIIPKAAFARWLEENTLTTSREA